MAALLWKRQRWDWKDAAVILFLAWAGATLAWSPDPAQGLVDFGHLALVAFVLLASRELQTIPLRWAAAGLILVSVFFNPSGNPNTQVETIALGIPALMVAGYWWPVGVLGAAGALFFFDSHMGWVALLGVAGVIAARKWGARPWSLPWWVLMGAIALAGFTVFGLMKWEILSRFQLYIGTLKMWSQAPLFGQGMGSFDYLWPRFQNADMWILPGYSYLGPNDPWVFAGFSHNDFLQVLAETGLVGFGLLWMVILIGFRPDLRSAIALGMMLAFLCVDFPLHNPETAVFGAIYLGVASPPAEKWSLQGKFLSAFLAVPATLVAIMLMVGAERHLIAEVHFANTVALAPTRQADAYIQNVAAYDTFPYDKRYRLELYRSMVRGFLAGKIKIEPEASLRLWNISRSAIPEQPALLEDHIFFSLAAGQCVPGCDILLRELERMNPRMLEVQRLRERLRGFGAPV